MISKVTSKVTTKVPKVTKAQLKVLLANHLYGLCASDGPAYVSILCYYFIDKDLPVMSAVEHFRQANVKVTMFPVSFPMPGFTNRVLALRPIVKYDIQTYNSLLRCLESVKEVLNTFPMLHLCGLFIRGHLIHIDQLAEFLETCKYYETYTNRDSLLKCPVFLFYAISNIIFKENFVRMYACAGVVLNLGYWNALPV